MTLVLGCLLGAGLSLVASPFLWPRRARDTVRRARPSALREALSLAGLPRMPIALFLALSAAVGLVAAALAQVALAVLAVTVAAFAIGVFVPTLAVNARANKRRQLGRSHWPDAVDHLVSAVRSGIALPEAVAALARTGPEATREAFAAYERDYRETGSFSHSIGLLKERLADPVADRILETLRMAREVGGTELSVVLRGLGVYLRQDAATRSELEARQSWVHAAARLGVAAPWVVLVLLGTRPEAAAAYNSGGGTVVIAVGLVVSVVAYRLMLALGRLPRERRWFT
ncbi:type II secretion system F family protein [Compostimonas suwonensis]|uniref:Tight adherence protein B n=1 Tax=Compostimonas suwonensis TaxID=1048394 RepID=A0A2M9BWS3_9MICO|nr:type II secretion system F family protein [Compostimonas suwonensis]PJJ62375.1 tight adherence protein B [Compostimonas suwonensis]